VVARKDFRATAAFSPTLRTDEQGKVTLPVTMPDSLTRFRVVALATARNRFFGKAEGTIVTQRRLNARTHAPRFLSQGDTFSLPVVLQNLHTTQRTVDVAARGQNLVAVGPAGMRVTVPPGDRAEVRFELRTRDKGRARIQTIAVSGDFADASLVEVPVWAPATTESFATYGTIDDAPALEALVVPQEIFPDVGGVEVELASTELQSLTDAYWYLQAYPFECAEQRSARMLATAAIWEILDAFSTPGRPTRKEVEAQRAEDLRALVAEQRADGGWGYFEGMKSDPYVTNQVLAALVAARARGMVVDNAVKYVNSELSSSLATLAKAVAVPVHRRADRGALRYEVSLAASALTALAAAKVEVRPRAERLHAVAAALDAYPLDARARLLAVVAGDDRAKAMRAQLLAALLSAVHETAAHATVTTEYHEAEQLLLVSEAKTTALCLDALIREAPGHSLVTKLARGVIDARRHGRWISTQENLAALTALRRYFDTYEKVTPDYTGKLWLGTVAYAEQTFVGRNATRAAAHAPWSLLGAGTHHDLALVKEGPGRMYYRVGITYAPSETTLPGLDAGFVVRRAYVPVDDPGDMVQNAEGSITVELGARLLVTIEVLNTTRRFAVALVDPLPAGFESVNESLATSERAIAVQDSYWDHRNLRDNRSEAFAMRLSEGTHRFSYTVRATTPGRFRAAPAKAEEMYNPETFGRSAGTLVIVE
jgi:hypothetical protein